MGKEVRRPDPSREIVFLLQCLDDSSRQSFAKKSSTVRTSVPGTRARICCAAHGAPAFHFWVNFFPDITCAPVHRFSRSLSGQDGRQNCSAHRIGGRRKTSAIAASGTHGNTCSHPRIIQRACPSSRRASAGRHTSCRCRAARGGRPTTQFRYRRSGSHYSHAGRLRRRKDYPRRRRPRYRGEVHSDSRIVCRRPPHNPVSLIGLRTRIPSRPLGGRGDHRTFFAHADSSS